MIKLRFGPTKTNLNNMQAYFVHMTVKLPPAVYTLSGKVLSHKPISNYLHVNCEFFQVKIQRLKIIQIS